jgi:hypothetical protein
MLGGSLLRRPNSRQSNVRANSIAKVLNLGKICSSTALHKGKKPKDCQEQKGQAAGLLPDRQPWAGNQLSFPPTI